MPKYECTSCKRSAIIPFNRRTQPPKTRVCIYCLEADAMERLQAP